MTCSEQTTNELLIKIATYREKAIDASIVGNSAQALQWRWAADQASKALPQRTALEALPLREKEAKAREQGDLLSAIQWSLAAYATENACESHRKIEILSQAKEKTPTITLWQRAAQAAQQAAEYRIARGAGNFKNESAQDCGDQAAFHAENAVDYIVRAIEAISELNHPPLATLWQEAAEQAQRVSLMWAKAAQSADKWKKGSLLTFYKIEVCRHLENSIKRKLLHLGSYVSASLSLQQFKDVSLEINRYREEIAKATLTGNTPLALCWEKALQAASLFLENNLKKREPLAQIGLSRDDWNSFIQGTSPYRHENLHLFLYGLSLPKKNEAWMFATDETSTAVAHYRYWITHLDLLLAKISRLGLEQEHPTLRELSQAPDQRVPCGKARYWRENVTTYRLKRDTLLLAENHNERLCWDDAAQQAEEISRLWTKASDVVKSWKGPLLSGYWHYRARHAENRAIKKLRTLVAKHFSFCLPEECLPDADCKKNWAEGKLVPRIEFTMFYSWIYQSWHFLQQAGVPSTLLTQLPEQGVVITLGAYVITSLGHDTPLPEGIFFIDVVADRRPHPGAHLHLVENRAQEKLLPNALFMPHWPQSRLLPRDPQRGSCFKNIVFFGEIQNLAPELQSEEWRHRLHSELGLSFYVQGNRGWHDYSNVDAVVAIRSFSKSRYVNKPATKLYNAWLAGVPFIGGNDAAYAADGRPGIDYLIANSPEEVFNHLKLLKEDPNVRTRLTEQGRLSGAAFRSEVTLERWKELLQKTIPDRIAQWQKKNALQRHYFFIKQKVLCFFYNWRH